MGSELGVLNEWKGFRDRESVFSPQAGSLACFIQGKTSIVSFTQDGPIRVLIMLEIGSASFENRLRWDFYHILLSI